jgi:hypothetical protein
LAMVSGIARGRIGLKATTGDERERDGPEDEENINAAIIAGIYTNTKIVKALILACASKDGA